MLATFAEILGATGLVVFAACVFVVARAWRVEATLKASTRAAAISCAAGLSVAGVSASAAAILDGPGVLAVHFRGRERWRRSITHVSIDAALVWLDELLAAPAAPKKPPSRLVRLLLRVKDWLLPRTDLAALPGLGVRLLAELREPALRGALTCGFSDPALTGRAAAWLYPIAGVLSSFGALDLSFDWSGKDIVEADVEASCRVTLARVIFETLRFARRHVHPLRKAPRLAPSHP